MRGFFDLLIADEVHEFTRAEARPRASRTQPDPADIPLSDYVKHRMRGFFDLLIADEVHEFKGRGSAQGISSPTPAAGP